MNSIPYKNQQNVNLRHAKSLEEIEDILECYTKTHSGKKGDYYWHIDQFQVFPQTESGKYPVLVVFHKMDLHKE